MYYPHPLICRLHSAAQQQTNMNAQLDDKHFNNAYNVTLYKWLVVTIPSTENHVSEWSVVHRDFIAVFFNINCWCFILLVFLLIRLKMISQVFILSSKGDHLIYKDCILHRFILIIFSVCKTLHASFLECNLFITTAFLVCCWSVLSLPCQFEERRPLMPSTCSIRWWRLYLGISPQLSW